MYTATPLLSCIMPTANRPAFVEIAIRRFLEQDYPRKELVIVDDGHVSAEDLVPDHPDIYYHRHPGGITLGEKRNWAIRHTRGNFIMHWDDDDWTDPSWATVQMEHLLETGADVTGMDQLYYFDPVARQAYQYVYPKNLPIWVAGATLCYRRSLWEQNPFPPVNVGEDSQFLWSEVPKVIVPHGAIDMYVATIHGGNTSPKYVQQKRWQEESTDRVTGLLGDDWEELREAVLAGR